MTRRREIQDCKTPKTKGEIELVVYPGIWQKPHIRPVVLHGEMVAVKGRMQRKHGSSNILANHFHDLSFMLDGMPIQSRDFQ